MRAPTSSTSRITSHASAQLGCPAEQRPLGSFTNSRARADGLESCRYARRPQHEPGTESRDPRLVRELGKKHEGIAWASAASVVPDPLADDHVDLDE